MGRHTAPIPIVPAGTTTLTPRGPVTDPRLFDGPIGTRADRGPAGSALQPTRPVQEERSAALDPREIDDDAIDEVPVRARPRSVRAVRAAEDAAAAEELPPPPFPRVRDLLFAGVALVVLVVAIGAALLP